MKLCNWCDRQAQHTQTLADTDGSWTEYACNDHVFWFGHFIPEITRLVTCSTIRSTMSSPN